MTDHEHHDHTTSSTGHDAEASRKFTAAVRGALQPLAGFRRPKPTTLAAAVNRISAAADEYLAASRASHIRTLADLERACTGNRELVAEDERKDDLIAELRKTIATHVTIEAGLRDQLADLEGQLAIARDHTAGKARTARPGSGRPAQPAQPPAADTPATPGPAKGRTARRGAS